MELRGGAFPLEPSGATVSQPLAAAAVAVTALWTIAVGAVLAGAASTPQGLIGFLALISAWPAALLAGQSLPALRHARVLRLALGWTVIVAAAALCAVVLIDRPRVAYAAPLLAVTAALAARRPAVVVSALVAVTAFYGSFTAFVYLKTQFGTAIDYSHVSDTADLLVAGLVLSGLWVHALKRRAEPLRVTPAIVIVVLYIALSLVEVFTAAGFQQGADSFRASGWHELVVFAVALACWREGTDLRIAKAIVVIALLAAGYAVLRLVIGPAERELGLGIVTANNFIDDRLGLIGSFPTRHSLGPWMAVAAPFCAGCALFLRGRWRAMAVAAAVLCGVAVIGSEVRVALVAAMAATLVVALAAKASPAFPQVRGATVGGVAAAVLVVGALALIVTSSLAGGDSAERFSVLLTPSQDQSYREHLDKWELALEDIGEHPFGQGLGSAGLIGERDNRFLSSADPGLDSSYLKVAYEQGMFVMLFFVFGLVLLAVELARAGRRLASPAAAGLAIAACGSLVALVIEFGTALYVQSVVVLAGWCMVGLGVAQLMHPRRG
jgi:hypothetical protein